MTYPLFMNRKYTWGGNYSNIHITFKIPEDDKKKVVEYKIVNKHLKIVYNDELIVEGEMYDYIERNSDGFLISKDTVEVFFTKLWPGSWPWLVPGSTLAYTIEENEELDNERDKILEEKGFFDEQLDN